MKVSIVSDFAKEYRLNRGVQEALLYAIFVTGHNFGTRYEEILKLQYIPTRLSFFWIDRAVHWDEN